MQTSENELFSETYRRFVRTRSTVVDVNDEFVWSVARKMTHSPEEAEAAVRQMQLDIEKSAAERRIPARNYEARILTAIARSRVLKFLGMI